MPKGEVGTGINQVEPFDVKITWLYKASRQQMGFSLRRLAAGLSTPLDVAHHVRDNLLEQVRLILPSAANVLGVDVVKPLTKEGASYSPASMTGGTGSTMGQSFLACVVSLKSEYRSREGQGRFFLPCMAESWSDEDNLSVLGRTSMELVTNKLTEVYVDTELTDPYKLINWHPLLPATRPTKGPVALPEIPATYYDVSSVRINPLLTTLRSRKQNVGS